METKPYSIQSPEQIAKDYGGNKQKIAEAMQMGVVDPTAGTLAGMFIDRMRSAAQAEQAPQQTVAQKTFAPPAPPMGGIGAPSPMPAAGAPAGLGATPEAAQMPQMPMAEMPAPEMPMAEMPEAEMPMPEEEAPVGMKGGGKVHGRFNASDKGSNYGADISLDDLTSFSLEGSGRRVFDPDVIRAALRHRKGDTEISAEHTLRGGTDYGIEKPFLGGRLGIHAGASRGFIPDSVRASYNRSFAEGGLTTLPLPDTMFDEPNNGGYAEGGIVAFAGGGGMSNLYKDVEYWESGGDQNATSKAGARGVMQLMPGTMKDPGFGVPSIASLKAKGLSDEDANRLSGQKYLDAMYRRYGDQPTALAAYNWGPGNVDKWLEKGGDPKKLPAETKKYISNIMKGDTPPIRERDTNTAQGFTSNLGDISDVIERRFGKTEEEKANDAALMARAKEMASPEYEAKERRDSMWETLASIGFNMASSKSPSLLQAVGEAAAAALPGAIADKKERKQLKDKALNLMVANGAKNRKDAMEKFGLAVQVQQNQLAQQQFGQKLELDKETLDLKRQELAATIEAAKSKGLDVDTAVFSMFNSGDPAMQAAAKEWIALHHPASGSTTDAAQRVKDIAGNTGGAAPTVIDFGTLTQPK